MTGLGDTADDGSGRVRALYLGSDAPVASADEGYDGVVLDPKTDGNPVESLRSRGFDCVVATGTADAAWGRLAAANLPVVLYVADPAAVEDGAIAAADAYVDRGSDDASQSLFERARAVCRDRETGPLDRGEAGPNRYRRAVEDAGTPVFVLDAARRVRTINEAAATLFDGSRSALRGSVLSTLLPAPADSDLEQALGRALAEDAPATVEFGMIDGSRERRFASTVSPLTDGTGAVVTCREVTERARKTDELDLLKQVLTRVLRHDVRSGLTVIRGQAEVLAERTDGDEREMAETVVEHSESLVETTEKARAIRNVLDSDEGRVALDLRTAVNRAVANVSAAYPDAEYGADLGDAPAVVAHRAFPYAVENLIENAVEHSSTNPDSQARQDAVEHSSTSSRPEADDAGSASASEPAVADAPEDAVEYSSTSPRSQGREDAAGTGSSEPSVADAPEDAVSPIGPPGSGPLETGDGEQAHVSITAESGAERVILRIADDGPGIAESELEVLERREETPLKHGTGIGLWLVDRVVERSGGDLSFDADDGTTVTIRLDRADPS